jgi:hypothetical protein
MIKKLRRESQGFNYSFVTHKPSILKKTEEVKETPKTKMQTRTPCKRVRSIVKDASSVTSKLASDDSYSLSGKGRKRKNSDQIRILVKHFKQSPRWEKHTVDKAAKESCLARAQVYKWGWDRKKNAPVDEGYQRPSKDEFGGYSKHDFVKSNDPIADLLNIDLDKQIKELDLSPISEEKATYKASNVQRLSKTPTLVDSKKRNRKMKEKEIELNVSPTQFELNLKNIRKSMKDAESQTPNPKPLKKEDFITPKKAVRLLNMDETNAFTKIKNVLFSEKENDSGDKSERKLTPSSDNSMAKKSKSLINSSDMKCSEVLTAKRASIQDENINIS